MTELMIFDMDGVLCDSEPLQTRARETLFDLFGIDGKGVKNVGGSHVELWEPLIATYHLTKTQPEIERMQHELVIDMVRSSNLPLNDGVTHALQELERRGIAAAVASSSSRWLVEHILEHYGISSAFRSVVTGNDVSRRKPSPEIYLKTLQQCQVDAAHALALEDSAPGLRSAVAAGIPCLRYQPLGTADEGGFDGQPILATIHRIDELLAYV